MQVWFLQCQCTVVGDTRVRHAMHSATGKSTRPGGCPEVKKKSPKHAECIDLKAAHLWPHADLAHVLRIDLPCRHNVNTVHSPWNECVQMHSFILQHFQVQGAMLWQHLKFGYMHHYFLVVAFQYTSGRQLWECVDWTTGFSPHHFFPWSKKLPPTTKKKGQK